MECCYTKQEPHDNETTIKLEKKVRYYSTCTPLHELINKTVIKFNLMFKTGDDKTCKSCNKVFKRYTEYLL